ncbi:hypothetical protein CEE61_08175 [Stenotrophomonas maltophilia]|jgi:hypothetical protein|uniref:Transmembrane protein n=1 Tax=Stenotrophomonas maltophilia TaxID=40324 RepID=A0AB34TD71_STEMA|nr:MULTISPECIES: hypothetical protein [Stenotrophomonas]KKF88550.1 hypothetical protein XY58_08590 [Stenotrophomonas maltophilia]KOO70237.1 hypothetical protein VL23_21450 [Stenotrophomonas maltophilia]MBA0255559.1 hypothetical protein [Stenotrophomonas maltophilia]MBA0454175.1 hypothetical protein [Stenotrophomonas maltophilia]MBA0480225.1 hypothetical protein [Stenotrophomonas maltophilia]
MIVGTFYRSWGPRGGDGFLGGTAPDGDNDGRAKIMNVPRRVYIQVYVMRDAVDVQYVASVLSGQDGVWRLQGIDRTRKYRVIGTDLAAGVNSAIQDWVVPAKMEP